MTALRKPSMSVDEFVPWAERQPERWELFDGTPVAMSPERIIHGDTKYRVARALDEAIAKAGVPCRFVLDSAAVRVDARSSISPTLWSIAATRFPAIPAKSPTRPWCSRCSRRAMP
jgi:Uma2 family endonuclease